MRRSIWIGGGAGLLLCLVGAVFAFALEGDPSWGDLKVDAFGLILLTLGAMVLAGTALAFAGVTASTGAGQPQANAVVSGVSAGGDNPLRAVGSLIGVVAGITAVVVIGLVTLSKFGTSDKNSAVAISTSAFGVISALVGAFLGIRVAGEQGAQIANIANDATAQAQKATAGTAGAIAAAGNLSPEAQQTIKAGIQDGQDSVPVDPVLTPSAATNPATKKPAAKKRAARRRS